MAVSRLEITDRKPWAGGVSFSEAGPYELIEGRIYFAVNPDDERNSVITDIALAPRNVVGKLEYSSDFILAKPVRAQAGGRLLYDVLNRGNKTALQLNLAAPASRPDMEPPIGDGFLMRNGFSLAWCGWQTDPPDVPGLLRGYFPEALEHGQRLQGQAFLQFQPSKLAHSQMLSDAGHRPLPAASLDAPDAVLTVRDYHDGPPATVPRHLWQFARPTQDGTPVPDASFIYSDAGFEPGKVYELVYTHDRRPCGWAGTAGDAGLHVRWNVDRRGKLTARRVQYTLCLALHQYRPRTRKSVSVLVRRRERPSHGPVRITAGANPRSGENAEVDGRQLGHGVLVEWGIAAAHRRQRNPRPRNS